MKKIKLIGVLFLAVVLAGCGKDNIGNSVNPSDTTAGSEMAVTAATAETTTPAASSESVAEVKLIRYDANFLRVFDTVTTITGYAEDEETFTAYATQIHDQLWEYHRLYDIYNDYEGINNIKTINDQAGIAPVVVDERIIDLLEMSKEMYERSGGSFNVAMGSVLKIWHDYRTEGIENPEQAKLPPMADLQEAAGYVDMDLVEIDRDASTVYLPRAGMRLDVGAIAKGYATEQVSQNAEATGMTHALLSVGGNVRAIGIRADGVKWQVGIQNPDVKSEVKYLHRVELDDMSLVSSGTYERYYTVEGKQYHHIIHGETLMPSELYVSVSILCRDSGLADALSTAIFNMPLEEGTAFIEGFEGVEAMWIEPDGRETFSSGFRAYIND